MKKSDAFTLIELLAIIVILAIIAVITVPVVLNIIEKSRKGAATNSAYGYKDAVNKWYVIKIQDDDSYILNGEYTINDGKLSGSNITNPSEIEVPISGDKPSSGTLVYSNNVLQGGCLVIGDYKVIFTGSSVSNTEKGDCSNYEYNV